MAVPLASYRLMPHDTAGYTVTFGELKPQLGRKIRKEKRLCIGIPVVTFPIIEYRAEINAPCGFYRTRHRTSCSKYNRQKIFKILGHISFQSRYKRRNELNPENSRYAKKTRKLYIRFSSLYSCYICLLAANLLCDFFLREIQFTSAVTKKSPVIPCNGPGIEFLSSSSTVYPEFFVKHLIHRGQLRQFCFI